MGTKENQSRRKSPHSQSSQHRQSERENINRQKHQTKIEKRRNRHHRTNQVPSEIVLLDTQPQVQREFTLSDPDPTHTGFRYEGVTVYTDIGSDRLTQIYDISSFNAENIDPQLAILVGLVLYGAVFGIEIETFNKLQKKANIGNASTDKLTKYVRIVQVDNKQYVFPTEAALVASGLKRKVER